ncbi:hypothetical protein GmRootA79_22980 [Acidovorax sp. A79]
MVCAANEVRPCYTAALQRKSALTVAAVMGAREERVGDRVPHLAPRAAAGSSLLT